MRRTGRLRRSEGGKTRVGGAGDVVLVGSWNGWMRVVGVMEVGLHGIQAACSISSSAEDSAIYVKHFAKCRTQSIARRLLAGPRGH